MAIILLYHKSKSATLLKSLITCRKFCSWGQNLAEVVNVCTLPLNVKLSWTLSGNSALPSFNHYPLVPTNKVYPTLERSIQGAQILESAIVRILKQMQMWIWSLNIFGLVCASLCECLHVPGVVAKHWGRVWFLQFVNKECGRQSGGWGVGTVNSAFSAGSVTHTAWMVGTEDNTDAGVNKKNTSNILLSVDDSRFFGSAEIRKAPWHELWSRLCGQYEEGDKEVVQGHIWGKECCIVFHVGRLWRGLRW